MKMKSGTFVALACLALLRAHAAGAKQHSPQDIIIKGTTYYAAHLEAISVNGALLICRGGTFPVNWNDLSAKVKEEYQAEHAAALTSHPATSVTQPKADPPAPIPPRNDLKTKDGTVYRRAEITSVDAATATISHASGIARVDLTDLPDELLAKVAPDYSPERAAVQQQAEKLADAQAAQAAEEQALKAEIKAKLDSVSVLFSGTITQITATGALMKGYGQSSDVTKLVIINGRPTPVVTSPGSLTKYECIFVAGYDGNEVDGDHWEGRLWPAGRETYTTVMGASRTVPRWAVTREIASRLLVQER